MLYRAFAVRRFATAGRLKTTTPKQRDAELKEANEKMRAYFENRPPIEKIRKMRKSGDGPRDAEHKLQLAIGAAFLVAFVSTPFVGRRIAQDEEFREKYVPKCYDFTLKKPENPWTREELHEQYIQLQHELHERAIRGEFTPEKLDEMRRHFAGVDPANDPHGWGKLHPGVDDDEDIEDD